MRYRKIKFKRKKIQKQNDFLLKKKYFKSYKKKFFFQ